MPNNKYLRLKIDNEELDIDVNADFPITFDYQLEDTQDFQKKKSSVSLGLRLPATLQNQKILNTFHNTSVEDNTPGKIFKSPRKIVAEANGSEIFIGKALPKKAIKRGGVPTYYELNCFGNNADWLLDLKEVSLYDLTKHIKFIYDENTIVNSWNFDGRDENMPYVFAPVKYGGWMDPDASNDNNYSIKSMKPSLSVYWILFWGFQSVGYRIESEFFDTPYFRKLVMPWSYGAFLSSEGTKYEIHKFLAKSDDEYWFGNMEDDYVDLNVQDSPAPCFDNNNTTGGDYEYVTREKAMRWTYNRPHYGDLNVTFSLALHYDYKIDFASFVALRVDWFKGDNHIHSDQIFEHTAPTVGSTDGIDLKRLFWTTRVSNGDVISCKVSLRVKRSKLRSVARCNLRVDEFKIEHFEIPVGGEILFDSYLTFQKNNFLDFLRGVLDLFNLSLQTDPVNKTVLIEPTHEYSLSNDLSEIKGGYFTKNNLDWTEKEDLSQDSSVEIYDDNSREFVFRFKDDSNDGALKIVQDRYKITLASGKYVFDDRFKLDKKEFENRYFSPTMHYLVDSFAGITGQPPQMVCLVPENISNTSSPEAQNIFSPKICFYKGLVTGVGGWLFEGKQKTDYPFMFSVNYKTGGENDPILSYTDEKIGDQGYYRIGNGLLKRFFWQRLAIMNNGQWLHTQFRLTNNDITNWFHRERINLNGELWELLSIEGYDSLSEESTKCILRKWVPISIREYENTFPSEGSMKNGIVVVSPSLTGGSPNKLHRVFDSQYNRLMCLYTDIPR